MYPFQWIIDSGVGKLFVENNRRPAAIGGAQADWGQEMDWSLDQLVGCAGHGKFKVIPNHPDQPFDIALTLALTVLFQGQMQPRRQEHTNGACRFCRVFEARRRDRGAPTLPFPNSGPGGSYVLSNGANGLLVGGQHARLKELPELPAISAAYQAPALFQRDLFGVLDETEDEIRPTYKWLIIGARGSGSVA